MKTQQIDLLNTGLMLGSLVVAFVFPFELFLFSYAVLGPLHYLTEINWLKGKGYFLRKPSWAWVFVLMAILITLPQILTLSTFKPFLDSHKIAADINQFLGSYSNSVLLMALLLAIGLVTLTNRLYLAIFLVLGFVFSIWLIKDVEMGVVAVGVFLPSLVHVYLFTWLFMMAGTKRSFSFFGLLNIVILALIPIFIAAYHYDATGFKLGEKLEKTFLASGFHVVTYYVSRVFGLSGKEQFFLYKASAIKIQVFVAFAYTYHYLNWFSKTTVIGWYRNLSLSRTILFLVIWFSSMALYLYDYRTGLLALFMLSLLHVFLEFPLNVASLKILVGAGSDAGSNTAVKPIRE